MSKQPAVPEITVDELKSMLDRRAPVTIIDIREPDEYEICHLDAKLIPLREIQNHLHELNPNELTVFYCHHGIRSAQAVSWLLRNGFPKIVSLRGGIEEWASKIDPDMDRY